MRSFLIKVSIFLAIMFAADFLVGKLLQAFRPIDYKVFIDSKKAFFEKEQDIDLLVIGDSHIADALDPRIIREQNHLNSFNLAIYAASPYENYYVLKSALEHLKKKPKILVLGTNPVMFTRPRTVGRYTSLIVDGFEHKWHLNYDAKKSINASFFFSTLQEHYLFSSMFKNLTGAKYTPTREVTDIDNGYLESVTQMPNIQWANFKPLEKNASMSAAINNTIAEDFKTQVEYFDRMIKLALANNIQVLLVNPPIWEKQLQRDMGESDFQDFAMVLKNASARYRLPVFNEDFQLFNQSLQQSDYLNTEHLNYYGAKKFTLSLSTWIKENQTSHLQSHE